MKLTRRDFVKATAAGGVGIAALGWPRRAWAAFRQSPGLIKFGAGQRLRLFGIPGEFGIPLANSVGSDPFGADYYEISMRDYEDTLHPDPAFGPTKLRGYCNFGTALGSQRHLEGAILAYRDKPVRVRWFNELTPYMPLPVDRSLVLPYAAEGETLGDDRAAPHLHGGLVPWPSDGGPFHWFNNPANGSSVKGPSVRGDVATWLGGTDDYWYPNNQSARFMWYHDHAVGITRLNAYAGLASGYIITEPSEGLIDLSSSGYSGDILMQQLGLPVGDLTRQVHLVVQDKIFYPNKYSRSNGDTGSPGDLWYPDSYDTQFFALAKNPANPVFPSPSTGAEFWGDTMLVNGTVYPYYEVEPRRYRFRILNACNTRFLSLRLLGALGKTFPLNTEADPANPGPAMTLIGTEGGFLDGTIAPKGVVYNNTAAMPLVLAPAERADIIVDFSKVKTVAGKDPLCFILYNDAPVPFPGGTPLADFDPANRKLAVPPLPGYGPNTRTLLQFRVRELGAVHQPPPSDPPVDPGWVLPPSPAPVVPANAPIKELALYETIDDYGRLAQQLGPLSGPLPLDYTPTEVVQAGTVEVWRIFNTTADTHPMHFHFFNVRVRSRQPFSWRGGMPNLTGGPLPPDPAEQGWKETVKFNPGECTELLVELPKTADLAPVPIPNSPRTGNHEYVWHCHILEHEEHDMMRPLIVLPETPAPPKP